jgi:leucyl-tRNA synthetase
MPDTSTSSTPSPADPQSDEPPFRYTAALAAEIEPRWQAIWRETGVFNAPNPAGPLAPRTETERAVVDLPKAFVMDMFPYPSGDGLHVGHPLGYVATDVYSRYLRMSGHNVLHTIGFDAFGLPAEQYAVQTGTHPRVTTEKNIERFVEQFEVLGFDHDARRRVATIDTGYYRWTQWIFLRIFNSWYDPKADKARPIVELIEQYAHGQRATPDGRPWDELNHVERAAIIDGHRLAYAAEAPVNWCPGLGTVLSNEEVTADGRSERGNFPVFKRNLRQWMMRITAYADRLLNDLDTLDWPEPIKLQQRNWIGRSKGARVTFAVANPPADAAVDGIEVFTTRPDTLFGATYVVLAPEHPAVATLTAASWPEGTDPAWTGGAPDPATAVAAYQRQAAARTDLERQTEGRTKTGVFTGGYAINPVNGVPVPVFVADYVLMGYGTGAIMAVPAHDHRDFEFARVFKLPMRCVVRPDDGRGTDPTTWDDAFVSNDAPAMDSANDSVSLDGLLVPDAKRAIIAWLETHDLGVGTVTYKLRDWLFSRQRYWGEPFPIVYDADGVAIPLPERMLPLELPEIDDYSPRAHDPNDAESEPEAPLSRAKEWVEVELDLGDGPRTYRRETNTMPNWAGSCWYYLRYIDPVNDTAMVEPHNEKYWMAPDGVDLYVGGAEHAVLHLLYSRFWHKVLYDLGYVSTVEPFHKLVNQGMIQAYAYLDERGVYVPAAEVEEHDGGYRYRGEPVRRLQGKMGKSLKNVVAPEEVISEYGADTMRLYEMSMGPLEVSRPWETRAVVGPYRFVQRLWRNVVDEQTGRAAVTEDEPDEATLRALHRAIDGVRGDLAALRFNTAVSKLIELNNHVTKLATVPRAVAEPLVLLTAPFAPHVAEELWSRLGHPDSLARAPFPVADPAYLVRETVTCVIQVAGKLRDRVEVPADADEDTLRELALSNEAVRRALEGRAVRTVVVRAPRLVNVVPA